MPERRKKQAQRASRAKVVKLPVSAVRYDHDREIALLVRILSEAFESKGWHGTTLLGSLRGLKPAEALWRPGRGRHNIWELVLHAAYWKYVVRRTLEEGKRGSFPREGSDWIGAPHVTSLAAWREDVALLKHEHARLRDAVIRLPPGRLSDRSGRGNNEIRTLIYGVAAHDVYHTGQIQLIKKLYREG